jgi:hypothetical protein
MAYKATELTQIFRERAPKQLRRVANCPVDIGTGHLPNAYNTSFAELNM